MSTTTYTGPTIDHEPCQERTEGYWVLRYRGTTHYCLSLADAEDKARIWTLCEQIGWLTVCSISGGRVRQRPGFVGIILPVSYGYSVEVELMPNDTYTVRRVFERGGKRWVKGEESNVYAEQVSDAAYRAGMFRNVEFGGVAK